jgi:hypothetical protein
LGASLETGQTPMPNSLMRVRMLVSTSSNLGNFQSEQVVDIPDNVAEAWIKAGLAEEYSSEPDVEAAVVEDESERAIITPKRKKRGR